MASGSGLLMQVSAAPAASLQQRQQTEAVAAATAQTRGIRRAARVAAFNGWTTSVCAAATVPFALNDPWSFVLAVGLAVVARNEFRGKARLLRFDPTAATMLGRNQLALLALVAVYCIWSLLQGLYGSSPLEAQLAAQPEIAAALGDVEQFKQLYRGVLVASYGAVLLLSCLFQGGNAVYYFRRRPLIERYLAETPSWIVELQQAASC